MDRQKTRLRFISPLAFELQMPRQDWTSIFPELTATLQSLEVYDTNSTTTSPSLK
jgi:transcription-repair coupling factor (superfamily II helicase)